MSSYNISDLNYLFKPISLMNGKEIEIEMSVLNTMGNELSTFIEPKSTDCEKVESSIDNLIDTYIKIKIGNINDDLKNLIVEHKMFIFYIILNNAYICSLVIDFIEKIKKSSKIGKED